MKWYLDLLTRTLDEGVWVDNKRTGQSCLTIINADFEYDCASDIPPLLLSKKVNYRAAFAEVLGYLRGYTNAEQFRALGTHTWDANANENESWLNNPHREGKDDMGIVYGATALMWPGYDQAIDALNPVIEKILRHEDDRGLIITFWNPAVFEYGCLRPCLHTWHFSILNEELHLTTYQRSADIPLGLPFNLLQGYFLVRVLAHIAGLKPGNLYMKFVNLHIYENQLRGVMEQLKRKPVSVKYADYQLPNGKEIACIAPTPVFPKFHIAEEVKTFDDLMSCPSTAFQIEDYYPQPFIKFPFSV